MCYASCHAEGGTLPVAGGAHLYSIERTLACDLTLVRLEAPAASAACPPSEPLERAPAWVLLDTRCQSDAFIVRACIRKKRKAINTIQYVEAVEHYCKH